MIGHRPAHDPAAACVDHDREEQESGPGRHVSDVGDPELVGCIGLESTLDEVRCPTSRVVAARGPRPFAPRYPCQVHLSHQSSHSLASDMDAVLGEFGVNARCPIGATAALMDVADARLEDIIALPAPRRLTVSPRVEPARGDAEHAGHRGDAVEGLIRSHELERFPGTEPVSRANQAAAFASICLPSADNKIAIRALRAAGGSHDEGGEAPRARRSSAHRRGDLRPNRLGGPSYGWSGPSTRARGRALESRAPSEPALPSDGETQADTADVFVASWIPPPKRVRYPRKRVNSTSRSVSGELGTVHRITTQFAMVVEVFIAEGDSIDSLRHQLVHLMFDARPIAVIDKASRYLRRHPGALAARLLARPNGSEEEVDQNCRDPRTRRSARRRRRFAGGRDSSRTRRGARRSPLRGAERC